MNKTVKSSLIVIAIVVVLFGIIWLIYDILKEEPVDANLVDSNIVDENTGLDNIINELFDNVVINEQQENVVKQDDTSKNNGKNVGNTNKEDEQEKTETTTTNESVTSKEERAIELVKREWGGTDGVYFSNESIDSQGRYIVSVRDKSSTSLLAFFAVDVSSGLVTKQ